MVIDKNIPSCCCVDIIISLNVYCVRTDADNTAINNIYFYSLLSIDKTKLNKWHDERCTKWCWICKAQFLYQILQMPLWLHCMVILKLKVEPYWTLKKKESPSPRRDRTWVACVIHKWDNHYTTPTVVSVSEIKYLYMYPCLLWETSIVKSSNCFQRCIARYCTQNAYFDIGRSVHFDRPKTYQIVPKMAPFDLICEADYPDNTTFFI